MILTCPNCNTRFLLSAQMLAPEGRKVKCSKCGEMWQQLPDPDELIENLEQQIEDIPEAVKPIPEGSSVPAIREEDEEETEKDSNAVPFGYAAAMGVFVLILGVLIFMKGPIFKVWPASAAFYHMLGMEVIPPGAGLEFDRVSAEIVSPGHMKIEGHILNLKSESQTIPPIEVIIKDSHGEMLLSWYMEIDPPLLEGEQSKSFDMEYKGPLEDAESIHFRFVIEKKKQETPAQEEEKHDDDAHAAPDDKHHSDGHH